MLKQVGKALVVALMLLGITSFFHSKENTAQADTAITHVKVAQTKLAKDETKLGQLTTDFKQQSVAIAGGELSPEDASHRMKGFGRKREDLHAKAEELDRDISVCVTARNDLGTQVDKELAAIRDIVLRRQIQRGWQHVLFESDQKVSAAQRAREAITAAEIKAADLEHAGRVLAMTDTVHRSNVDLDGQRQKAQEAAAEFSKSMDEILASLAGESSTEEEVAGS